MSKIARRAAAAAVAIMLACLGLGGPAWADPPTAGDLSATVSTVHMTPVDLSSAVTASPSATYAVVTRPHDGMVSFQGAVAQYVPLVGNSAGDQDSFTYQVTDGADTSNVATVNVTFNAVPTADPDGTAAAPIKIKTQHPTQIELSSFAHDADGDSLTFARIGDPASGHVTFSGSTATLTPQGTPTGSDSFTFRVSDGIDTSNTATVTVVYNAVPQVQNKSLTVSGVNPTNIDLAPLASDPNGDPLTFAPGMPTEGKVTKVGSSTAHFVPPTDGFFGADPFTYTVGDGFDSATATITVHVNDVPSVTGPVGTVSVPFNSPGKAIGLQVNDGDNSSHTLSVVDSPVGGSVGFNGSTAIYTPEPGFTGQDSFSVRASDGIDDSATRTIVVNVAQAPDKPPHATDGSATVAFDGQGTITLQATDPNGDPLTYSVTQPQHGTVSSGKTAVRTYTPDKGYAGTDSFAFTATDPDKKSSTATVTITVSKASAAVQSVTFAPAHPTPGTDVTAQVSLATKGSVRGGTLTMWEGSHTHRTTMSAKTATVHIGQLAAGKHTFQIRYDGTKTTSSVWTVALPIKVAKAVSSLRVSSTPKQLTTRDRGVATVHVSAGGASVDGALVTIKEAGKTLGSAVVRDGAAKITLPKFGLGQHNLAVSYAGNADVTSATKNWTVRVALG